MSGCKSTRLRRLALQNDDITLGDLLAKGRAYESSEQQASAIEATGTNQSEVHRIRQVDIAKKMRKPIIKNQNPIKVASAVEKHGLTLVAEINARHGERSVGSVTR